MSRLIILSDIHANLSALDAVLADAECRYEFDAYVILGDVINYGMRPDAVTERLQHLPRPTAAAIFGNHERALLDGDTSRFSTDRGRRILEYTRSHVSENTLKFLTGLDSRATAHLDCGSKRILFVHGSLSDPYWGKMTPEEMSRDEYRPFDFVVCGHSHMPMLYERLFEDPSRTEFRCKKRVVFLNPGSVGQPRNHNPLAQYLFLDTDTETFCFNAVPYDIAAEQALFAGKGLDDFYKTRLSNGL